MLSIFVSDVIYSISLSPSPLSSPSISYPFLYLSVSFSLLFSLSLHSSLLVSFNLSYLSFTSDKIYFFLITISFLQNTISLSLFLFVLIPCSRCRYFFYLPSLFLYLPFFLSLRHLFSLFSATHCFFLVYITFCGEKKR